MQVGLRLWRIVKVECGRSNAFEEFPNADDRQLLSEAVIRFFTEAPLRWEMFRLRRPVAAFAGTFIISGVFVVLAHAVVWLVAGGGSTAPETLNTLRYTLSAIAQSLAAVLGLTFTALLIGMQFFSERYAAAASKFLLRDPVTHATAGLGSWSVLSALVLLSGVGLPFGTTPPIPVLAVNIALASITVGTAVFLAFRVMGRFSHDDFLGAISQHLIHMSRATIPRVARRERREAEIDAVCEELGVKRTPITIWFKHMVNVGVGKRRAADMRTRPLQDLVRAAYAVNEDATEAPLSLTLKLDAGPEKVSIASWHADAPVPPVVRQLARECVVTQPLPHDLWEDDAVSFSPLVAVAESALSKRDFGLAQRALTEFQRVLRDTDEALSISPDLAPSRLGLFADALSSLQDLGTVFIDIMVPGREMTYREEEVGDAIRRAMGLVAEIALRRRDYSLWDDALLVMSRHAHALLQAGHTGACEDLAGQLHMLLSLGLWSYDPRGQRRRPGAGDAVFVERSFRSALSLAIAEIQNGRPEPAAHVVRQILNGALPGGADALRSRHTRPHEMVLEDSAANEVQREHASQRLVEIEATLSFQEQTLRHATAAFYGVAFAARANEWDGLADFAAEWITSLAREVNRQLVEDTRFLDRAAEDTSSEHSRVTTSLFSYTPQAQQQFRREGIASRVGGLDLGPLHFAVRLALAKLHGGYFDLDLIPYSEEAAVMGEANRLDHAINGLADLADFLEALGVTVDDQDIEALRAVYSGHAEEREQRERQALLDAPLNEASILAVRDAVAGGIVADPVFIPGFKHAESVVPEEHWQQFNAMYPAPRRWFTQSAEDVSHEGSVVRDWFIGRLAGYCLYRMSETAGRTAVASERDGRLVADLILQELPGLQSCHGWAFIPISLRRRMRQHPDCVVRDGGNGTVEDSPHESLACADVLFLSGDQGDQAWAVQGDAIATYSVGDVSVSIVDEPNPEEKGEPMLVLEVTVPIVIDFAVDPEHIVVINLPSGEEDTNP